MKVLKQFEIVFWRLFSFVLFSFSSFQERACDWQWFIHSMRFKKFCFVCALTWSDQVYWALNIMFFHRSVHIWSLVVIEANNLNFWSSWTEFEKNLAHPQFLIEKRWKTGFFGPIKMHWCEIHKKHNGICCTDAFAAGSKMLCEKNQSYSVCVLHNFRFV